LTQKDDDEISDIDKKLMEKNGNIIDLFLIYQEEQKVTYLKLE